MTYEDTNIFVFCDKISDNFITFRKNNEDVWIDRYYVDQENGKLFVMLLKDSFQKMKDKGCKIYKQYVSADEWESFLKNISGWEVLLHHDNDNVILIACTIDDAPTCIVNGLLIDN